MASLTTQVRSDGIYVRFFPRHLSFRRIPWDELESVESLTYHPILAFGGMGLRWRPGRMIYSVSGTEAVVRRAGMREFWIGTKRSNEFVAAVDQARP